MFAVFYPADRYTAVVLADDLVCDRILETYTKPFGQTTLHKLFYPAGQHPERTYELLDRSYRCRRYLQRRV